MNHLTNRIPTVMQIWDCVFGNKHFHELLVVFPCCLKIEHSEENFCKLKLNKKIKKGLPFIYMGKFVERSQT